MDEILTTAPTHVMARVLPPDEYYRIAHELPNSPLANQNLHDFSGVMLVFERDGHLVGHWPILLTWHAEPCYLIEGERMRVETIKTMIAGLTEQLAANGIPVAFAITDIPNIAAILGRLGFHRVPGSLYYALASPPPSEESR